jgi:hypothetical protein
VRSISVTHEECTVLRCVLSDSTGSISLLFQGREKIPGVERGSRLMVRGTVQIHDREAVILNPEYEIVAGPQTED